MREHVCISPHYCSSRHIFLFLIIFSESTDSFALKKTMRRKFQADEVLHIYQRTISGFNIFYSTEDFLVFYTIVSVYARRFGIVLLGLCQMIDHIHLLGSAGCLADLSRFVSAYTSRFVKEFNSKSGRTGPLFEKGYGSALKREAKKIRSAIAYLFNNPVEKILCARAEEYKWNYLRYYGNLVSLKGVRNYSTRLQKSVKIVQERFQKGRYLNYSMMDMIFEGLGKEEREYLTDYIIMTYFPFDAKKLTSYYKSYEDMLIAINSNTGSEHDIQEHHYSKTDLAYREMISYLKNHGLEDVRSVVTMNKEDKMQLAALLKSKTSATYRQIGKFLHMEPQIASRT